MIHVAILGLFIFLRSWYYISKQITNWQLPLRRAWGQLVWQSRHWKTFSTQEIPSECDYCCPRILVVAKLGGAYCAGWSSIPIIINSVSDVAEIIVLTGDCLYPYIAWVMQTYLVIFYFLWGCVHWNCLCFKLYYFSV